MTARPRPGLRAPATGDVGRVPSTSRRRPLWRACDRRHEQPWWFSTRTSANDPGRFDLRSPRGTCYWALSAPAAVIEVTSDPDQLDPPVLTLAALERLAVWQALDVPAARSKLADITRAAVPGLTAELSTIVPYDIPWAWADALHADGRHGLLYVARFALEESVALFGAAGAPCSVPPASRSVGLDHYEELPSGFRAGIGSVGDLASLPRAHGP